MDSVDLEVLKAAAQWSESGYFVTLGTVVRTWGSAPRPVGSTLAIREDGRLVGSVSGGCVEDDLVERIRSGEWPQDLPQTTSYGVSAEEAHRFGLPCGGTLQLVLEPVRAHTRVPELLAAIGQYRLVVRELDMATGEVRIVPGHRTPSLEFDGQRLITSHGPRHRLVVIGAGQLSRYVASMATALDYHVIVCEPRAEYADEWNVPNTELTREMPDDLIIRLQLDSYSAVVTLTHDPKLDDMALLEALKSPAFYIGAIGSRVNNAKRRERLSLFDLSAAEISRLHGPVGLHLGARTPAEIAVAILAEMTAIKNGIAVRQTFSADAPNMADDASSCTV
ncbi:putative xanthine dehydrogenase subunit A [Pandoraea terrae]|uniref:Putative xanthine dehydrogenase subunit A n=1 Tax=Pandoraea terrae TaxID=1537710 RepID=A0A5E4UQC2_9BURK|nr:XdhC family protein [Pandoraea terrae]VVE02146.1 putative xanthine dehydrogenase subunit A [Pandoraea terrae]